MTLKKMRTKLDRHEPSVEVEKFKVYEKNMGGGIKINEKSRVGVVDVAKNRSAFIRSSVAPSGGIVSSIGPIQAEIAKI